MEISKEAQRLKEQHEHEIKLEVIRAVGQIYASSVIACDGRSCDADIIGYNTSKHFVYTIGQVLGDIKIELNN